MLDEARARKEPTVHTIVWRHDPSLVWRWKYNLTAILPGGLYACIGIRPGPEGAWACIIWGGVDYVLREHCEGLEDGKRRVGLFVAAPAVPMCEECWTRHAPGNNMPLCRC